MKFSQALDNYLKARKSLAKNGYGFLDLHEAAEKLDSFFEPLDLLVHAELNKPSTENR